MPAQGQFMNQVSIDLSTEYMKRFGNIYHHNLDKGLLAAGETEVRFGGGVVKKPILIVYGDRATFNVDGEEVPVNEIAINSQYVAHRQLWQTCATLLHEVLHAWQQRHGKPGKNNYHNVEFRAKARSLGLIVDERGRTAYEKQSPFKDLLRDHGVELSDIIDPPASLPRSKSTKLRRWSCSCTNVWVAVADFHAQCIKCDRPFVRGR